MFKQSVCIALVASLLGTFAPPVSAGSQAVAGPAQTASVKAAIVSRGTGADATVTLTMRDGAKVKGYIRGWYGVDGRTRNSLLKTRGGAKRTPPSGFVTTRSQMGR